MQELVAEYCWGKIWTRPRLDRTTCGLINLAMIVALNRPHEVKAHLRGALNNGVSKEEICEVFLQTAVYCGVPAAIDSFRIARELFKGIDGGARGGRGAVSVRLQPPASSHATRTVMLQSATGPSSLHSAWLRGIVLPRSSGR